MGGSPGGSAGSGQGVWVHRRRGAGEPSCKGDPREEHPGLVVENWCEGSEPRWGGHLGGPTGVTASVLRNCFISHPGHRAGSWHYPLPRSSALPHPIPSSPTIRKGQKAASPTSVPPREAAGRG